VTVKVVRGTTADVEIQIVKPASAAEVGALALRLFRNDGTGPGGWIPRYHEEDNIRTTVMIPGLPAGQTAPVRYALDIPGTSGDGDTMRLVVTLDSGQLSTPATAVTAVSEAMPRSEIVLEIEKKCSGFCCWWKGLWD
jgi:hypothetical protein